MYIEGRRTRKKNSVMKILMVFMVLCILCSFILNFILYRRIEALERQINALDMGRITTEQNDIGGTV